MSGLEIRLAALAGVLIVIAGSLLYGRFEHQKLIATLQADKAAATAQATHDHQVAQDTISDLHNQLATLASNQSIARPAPAMRLCIPTRFVSAQPAPGGAQPGEPAIISGDSGVSGGVAAGPDIGPAMHDLTLAGVLLATYRGELWDWAVKQASESR